jgi:hypothetical protein
MIVLLPGGKIIEIKSLHLSLSGHLGKGLLLIIILIINSIPNVILSNCPLLHSFMNDTGILFVNKTTMMTTESTIHCQWLVAGSAYQVRKIGFTIFDVKFFHCVAYCG